MERAPRDTRRVRRLLRRPVGLEQITIGKRDCGHKMLGEAERSLFFTSRESPRQTAGEA